LIAQSLWIDIPQRIRRSAHTHRFNVLRMSRPVGRIAFSFARVPAPRVFERLVEAPCIRYAYSALLIPKFLRSHVSKAAELCGLTRSQRCVAGRWRALQLGAPQRLQTHRSARRRLASQKGRPKRDGSLSRTVSKRVLTQPRPTLPTISHQRDPLRTPGAHQAACVTSFVTLPQEWFRALCNFGRNSTTPIRRGAPQCGRGHLPEERYTSLATKISSVRFRIDECCQVGRHGDRSSQTSRRP
jgi:hypothetical protein